jgi:hypothetical protein
VEARVTPAPPINARTPAKSQDPTRESRILDTAL